MDENLFYTKYSEWFKNRTPEEFELHGDILKYQEEYFEDMTLQPNSPLHNIAELMENMYDVFSVELEFQYYTFHIADLNEGTMGETCHPERKTTITPKYKNSKPVILHEMIHAYEHILHDEHFTLNELMLLHFYNKLKPLISDLDTLIKKHAELYGQHCVSSTGGSHGILFYLKSLDLDIRCGYELGTVCGYGRDTGDMWYY